MEFAQDQEHIYAKIERAAKIWCANPYSGDNKALRDQTMQELHGILGSNFWPTILQTIDNKCTTNLFIKHPGQSDAAVLMLAFGLYNETLRDKRTAIETVLRKEVVTPFLTHKPKLNLPGVIAAAKRCEDRLSKYIGGTSTGLKKAKEEIWSAAFAGDLRTALNYWKEIRLEPVLITGETGTGKEEAFKALVAGSFMEDGTGIPPSIPRNVAAASVQLITSELFGHLKGAFSDASQDRTGAVRSADRGLLFLDEIGELSLRNQVLLLRVLETRKVQPLGSDEENEVDVRIVVATHKSLEQMVRTNKFRKDLYYRLVGKRITMPPLRDLEESDFEKIVTTCLQDNRSTPVDKVLSAIKKSRPGYTWPGNVRELKNTVRHIALRGHAPDLISLTQDEARISLNEVPEAVKHILSAEWTRSQVVDWYTQHVYDLTKCNKAATARILGISRVTNKDKSNKRKKQHA